MKWKRGQGYDQIEDRRGQAGAGPDLTSLGGAVLGGAIGRKSAGGGLGLIIVVIIGLLLISGVLGGGSGLSGLSGLGAGAGEPGGTLSPQSETDEFVAYIVSDVQDFWAETFSQSGRDYPETKLVLFTGSTSSGCGPASSATGPFYCPADQKVYLDLEFFDELKSRFGAPGDFAMAYVIAHEFGHHIQTATGVSQAVQDTVAHDGSRSNELSVKQELQADCLAGVWAHSAISELDAGDVEEALTAAAAVGDDRIQQGTTGRIDPESWTHGSSQQRQAWFTAGYRSGNVADCDTFAAG
jgi:predicted metalloprotease